MPTIPHLTYSKAEGKVKLESFIDIKPRRGVIEWTSPKSSVTPVCSSLMSNPSRTTTGTLRYRSQDQVRQAAGRSGGVFEIARDATTPWELQYTVVPTQEVFVPSNKTPSSGVDMDKKNKGVAQQVDRKPLFTSRANRDSAELIQCLSEYHTFDPSSEIEFLSDHEITTVAHADEHESVTPGWQGGFVSRWSATTSSTGDLSSSDGRVACYVEETQNQPAHPGSTSRTQIPTPDSMHTSDYACFRRRFHELMNRGYECSHAYDQVMLELMGVEDQENNDVGNGSNRGTVKPDLRGYEQDVDTVNTRSTLRHREDAYKILCGF